MFLGHSEVPHAGCKIVAGEGETTDESDTDLTIFFGLHSFLSI